MCSFLNPHHTWVHLSFDPLSSAHHRCVFIWFNTFNMLSQPYIVYNIVKECVNAIYSDIEIENKISKCVCGGLRHKVCKCMSWKIIGIELASGKIGDILIIVLISTWSTLSLSPAIYPKSSHSFGWNTHEEKLSMPLWTSVQTRRHPLIHYDCVAAFVSLVALPGSLRFVFLFPTSLPLQNTPSNQQKTGGASRCGRAHYSLCWLFGAHAYQMGVLPKRK